MPTQKDVAAQLQTLSLDEQVGVLSDQFGALPAEAQQQTVVDQLRALPADVQQQMVVNQIRALPADAQQQAVVDQFRALPAEAQQQAAVDQFRALPAEAQQQTVVDQFRALPSAAQQEVAQQARSVFGDVSGKDLVGLWRIMIVGLMAIAIGAGVAAYLLGQAGNDTSAAFLAVSTTIVGGLVGLFARSPAETR